MKKIIRFLLLLSLIIYIILSIFVFAIGNILAFKYTIISISVFILLAMLYWVRYSHLKGLKNFLYIFMVSIIFYIGINQFIMIKGIYLDASSIIWLNGQVMTKSDKEKFTAILSSLENYHTHIKTEPTYTISFTGRGDYDPRHLHVFRNKGFIYQGCLLGLEGGLELDGYRLTKKTEKLLEKLNNKYPNH